MEETRKVVIVASVDVNTVKEKSRTDDFIDAVVNETEWMNDSGIFTEIVTEQPELYLYKEHCDSDAYGDEITELFIEKAQAVQHLKERVEHKYKLPFDEIPDAVGLDESDSFSDTYVSINNGNGVCFWIVEEKTIKDFN